MKPTLRVFQPLLLALTLFAQAAAAQEAVRAPEPSTSTVVNLIRLMVKRGLLSQAEADGLLQQAQDEAKAAQAAAVARAAPPTLAQPPADMPAGAVFVPYVPETVRDQIREQLKADVFEKARAEKWASPDAAPDWTRRITFSGDLRLRDEYQLLDGGNGSLIDYAALNATGPYDINPGTNPLDPPFQNTREDRNNLLRVRARFGFNASIADEVSAGLRLATGNNTSPVSTNQVLGGGFSKKDLWLDRAYVDIHPWPGTKLWIGRMPNPFLATDLVYDEDLNFDGLATKFSRLFFEDQGISGFASAGAFPLQYGSDAFPVNSPQKHPGDSKWLIGAQAGVDWKIDAEAEDRVRFAAAYYEFSHVQGRTSERCQIWSGVKDCSSDPTAPAFMQKGNTVRLLRDIEPDPASPGNFRQPQFVGLTFAYRLLDLVAQFDYDLKGPVRHLSVQGEFVRNLAYDEKGVCGDPAQSIDNPLINFAGNSGQRCPQEPPEGDPTGSFQSGPNGWMLKTTVGDPGTAFAGAWNTVLAYKYLQPDAVLDGFTDSDFHLGGTNAKGYIVGGSLGLFRNTWLTARWMSASEVFGPKLSIDVFQLDLNAKF